LTDSIRDNNKTRQNFIALPGLVIIEGTRDTSECNVIDRIFKLFIIAVDKTIV
jgi:hypothetical protein